MSEKTPPGQNVVDPPATQAQPADATTQPDEQVAQAPKDLKDSLSKTEKWFVVILIALAAFFG